MENILTILREIFTGKDNSTASVGLSEYKTVSEPVKRFKKAPGKVPHPQKLRLSELMRKAY